MYLCPNRNSWILDLRGYISVFKIVYIAWEIDEFTQRESMMQKRKEVELIFEEIRNVGARQNKHAKKPKINQLKERKKQTRKAWYHDAKCFEKENQLDPMEMKYKVSMGNFQ